MGRLVQIEVENFKSYKGHQVIGPFTDFTAVIGPNGAGKSNLMDAISFVLGLKGKHLRASELKQLIFRADASAAPAKRASVKLIYQVDEEELEGYQEGDQIEFMRTVSGAGASTYRINKKEVLWKDYEDTLQMIGVLVKARNFLVFQGEVESIASKSPLELTKLLEEISGSDALSKQYEDARQASADAEEAATIAFKTKRGVQQELKQVREQKEEALRYEAKLREFEELRQEFLLWRIYHVKKGMAAESANVVACTEELEEIKTNEQNISDAVEKAKKERASVNRRYIEEKKELEMKRKRLQQITPDLIKLRDEMRNEENRRKKLEKSEEKIAKDKHNQDAKIKGLEKDIRTIDEVSQAIDSSLEQNSDVHLDAADLEEYENLKEQAQSRTVRERMNLEQARGSQVVNSQALEQLEAEERQWMGTCTNNENIIKNATQRIETLTNTTAATEKERDTMERSLADGRRKIDDSEALLRELDESLSEIREKLRNVTDERRTTRHEERMNEAIEAMKRHFPDVYGRLGSLCEPIHSKYAVAATIAGGKEMDAIVVGTRNTANACVKYLRDQHVGVARFLPLDHIRTVPVNESLRELGSQYRPVVDVIKSDPIFKKAVLFAVKDAVVCDTLQDARFLRFERGEIVKCVTLDGNVIAKSGAMTGGALEHGQTGSRWQNVGAGADAEKLRKDKSRQEERAIALRKEMPSRGDMIELEANLRRVQQKLACAEADITVTREGLARHESQLASAKEQLQRVRESIASVRSTMNTQSNEISLLEARVRSIEKGVFADFTARVGDIREFEQIQVQESAKKAQQRKECMEQKAKLVAQLEYERKRDFAAALKRIKVDITDTSAKIKQLEQREIKENKKEQSLTREVIALEDKIKQHKVTLATISEKLLELESERKQLERQRGSVIRKKTQLEGVLETLRGDLHELLKHGEMEQIPVPRSTLTDASQRASDSSTPSQTVASGSTHFSQSENTVVLNDLKNAENIDLSSVVKHTELSHEERVQVHNGYEEQISSIREELDKVTPNMKAVERFTEVEKKAKEFSAELDRAKEASRAASDRFNEVRQRRSELFMECFEHVNESLNEIFERLTQSSKHPYGGKAYLHLENFEEPYLSGILYSAAPPLKRIRSMEQLSGGEKTVASLALLFAIHSFRQAPFFVMDEIDAALDNVNIQKVCNYISQRTKEFQCIVISLKDIFYEHAQSLVGICRDTTTRSSRTLTLDLTQYDSVSTINRRQSESQDQDLEDDA